MKRLRGITIAVTLGAALFAVASCARVVSERRELAEARAALQAARVELQRAETVASLLRAYARAAAPPDLELALEREALDVAVLEAAAELAALHGVSDLRYRLETELLDEPFERSSLRLALSFRARHAIDVLDALASLRERVALRPMQVAGCRLLRTERSIAASCALDWFWWPTP